MSFFARLIWKSGRLTSTPISEGWAPTLTTRDPQISNLPLETPSSGGLTAVAADTVALSDSAVGSRDAAAAAVDTLTTSDSAAASLNAAAVASDSASLSDSAVATVSAPGIDAVAADTLTTSDSAVGSRNAVASAADTLTTSDSAAASTSGTTTAVAVDSVALSDTAVATRTPPPGAGGKSAWLRTWLQEQYTKDFARYEAERAAKPAPKSTPERVAKVRGTEPAEPASGAPTPRSFDVRALLAAAPRSSAPPEPRDLPPELDLSRVHRAASLSKTVRLRPDEEEAILAAAMILNL